MAIVQVSRITHRKGLQENLPQLSGAEFGWTVDERRLFIGNGTLEDGAPTIGNTEILTEHSNLLQLTSGYTYRGAHGGYIVTTGPSVGQDIAQSMQAKLDNFASVMDFGAEGDGVTDDTAAINRALYEVFCRDINPKVRRSLFFPAGVYLVTDTILIPPYAKLYGEGVNSSTIKLVNSDVGVVARTSDALQQIGSAIGNNGAILPSFSEIFSMSFESAVDSSIFAVDQGFDISFQNVGFIGDRTLANNTNLGNNTYGLTALSSASNKSKNIRINQCMFYGTTNGILINDEVSGVVVSSSRFDNLYNGVQLGTDGSASTASSVIVSSSIFDHVYNKGFETGQYAVRNISANNVYLDVGNALQGSSNPQTHIVAFASPNNISMGDMFDRSDENALVHDWERVHFGNNDNIAIENGVVLRLGTLSKEAGDNFTLINNTVIPEEASAAERNGAITPIVFDNGRHRAVTIYYSVVRGSNVRVGRINVMQILNETGQVAFTDDQYTETGPTLVTFRAFNTGYLTYIYYTLENQGNSDAVYDAVLSYSLEYFRDPTLN